LPPDIQAYSDFISKSLKTGDRNEELMIGIVKHLLQENNMTLVLHHALQVTGSPETVNSYPEYSYHHTDHPIGNRVAHLGMPLFTSEPNYGSSKIAPPAQPNLHTSNTSLNAPGQAFDLQLTTSTQPTPQQVVKPIQQQKWAREYRMTFSLKK
jgi:hypothetical protein